MNDSDGRKATIGVIGAGTMGSAFAESLLAAGHDVVVFNRTATKMQPLVDKGARRAETAAEALGCADRVILVLTDAAATRDVLFSDAAAAAALNGCKLLNVAATTVEEIEVLGAQCAAQGASLCEADVTVYPDQVRSGQAHIVLAGDSVEVSEWENVLTGLGAKIYNAGALGGGSKAEVALWLSYMFNVIAAAYTAAAASKLGVPGEIVLANLAENPVLRIASSEISVPQMMARRYITEGFSIDNFLTASGLVVTEARHLGLPTDVLEAIRGVYSAAAARGHGTDDVAAVFEALVG